VINIRSKDYKLLETQLARRVEKWLSMPNSNMEERDKTKNFYWADIFPLLMELFQYKERYKVENHNLFGLILTVGTSPEPLILSIITCQPERVLFLYTPQTEKYLDQIIEYTGLKISQIDKSMVEGADSLAIYQIVMQTWENWGRRKSVAVDITGGTKAMTGGLAMAGALLGFQLLYVASDDFLHDKRCPRPGSEHMVVIPNPYIVFGSLQENEARDLYKRQDYHGASKTLAELVNNVPDSRRFEVFMALSKAYEEWDVLNIKGAIEHFTNAINRLEKLKPKREGIEILEIIKLQRGKLLNLAELIPDKPGKTILPLLQNKEAVETLVFTIYYNAQRMADRGKYDSAALYLYRLLEIFEQRRFASFGIDTGSPCYENLPTISSLMLLERVNQIKESKGQSTINFLPPYIALANGYLILEALGDRFQLKNTRPKPIQWSSFLDEKKKRNYSILAHGFIFVSEEQYKQLKIMVDSIFDLFCLIEDINRDRAFDHYHFIENPFEKINSC